MIPALWDDGVEAIDIAPVHWSTSTILSIFFAACLVSALFFGLGYSFGVHGTGQLGMEPPGIALGTAWLGSARSSNAVASADARPIQSVAAGSATPRKRVARHSSGSAILDRGAVALVTPKAAIAERDAHRVTHPTLRRVTVLTPAVPRTPLRHTPAVANPRAGTARAHTMVQVAAIRSRRDARNLASQLRKKGFDARVYTGKHDPYLHVQIGPFSTVSQAQMMRRRVMSSGYRAVLK